jgi:hypothetical protein
MVLFSFILRQYYFNPLCVLTIFFFARISMFQPLMMNVESSYR